MKKLIDFYELTMEYTDTKNNKSDEICYFDVFFRTIPDKAGYAICAGLEQVVDYIKDLSIDVNANVSLNDAYMFLVYCKDSRQNNEKTRARKVTTLRMFYKYLTIQKRILDENPLQELESPKIKKSLPK